MYNCYCDMPIWDWFKAQPKSYFETIIREGGMVSSRYETKGVERAEEWKLLNTPCNTSEKLVLREIIRHYIESVANCKITRIEVVSHVGTVKKFTVKEFMSSVKDMTINLTDEHNLIREDGNKVGYQSHSIHRYGDCSYAKHDHHRIVEWWGDAIRPHYADRDRYWLECKTLEEFYREYPEDVWGDHWENRYFGR